MTTGYDLWDFQVWDFFITLAILFLGIIVANVLIRTIKPLGKLLIPAPVLGGFILLFVMAVWKLIFGEPLLDEATLEILTYHGLGLGCAALALKSNNKDTNFNHKRDIFNASLITTSTYLLQAIIGLIISMVLSIFFNCWPTAGLLLQMGYGQGPGQAYNWGHTYEVSWGFENGTSFGLTIAALGFIACSIGGVLYLNIMKRKGSSKILTEEEKRLNQETFQVEDFVGKNDIPMSDSMDKLTAQVALTFITYGLAFALSSGISALCDYSGIGFLLNTVKPLVWGFNFIFATLAGVLMKMIMKGAKKSGVLKQEYTNNLFLDRVSGLMFDLMIVAAIASINLTAFKNKEFVVPLLLMCVLAGVGSYIYVDKVCQRLYPKYNDEAFLSLFGMLTGVVGTGVVLLREIDPKFETPACQNLVFQTLWTCLLGFPILLFMGLAPMSTTWRLITLASIIVLFIAFYSWIRINSKKIEK